MPQGSRAVADLVARAVPAAACKWQGEGDEQGAGERFFGDARLLGGGFVRADGGVQGVGDEVVGDLFAGGAVGVCQFVMRFAGVVEQGEDGVGDGVYREL